MGLETQHVIGMHIWSWLFCSLTLLHQHQPGKKEVQDYIKKTKYENSYAEKKKQTSSTICLAFCLKAETYFVEVLG